MVWWALTLVFLTFHLGCVQPLPTIVRARLAFLTVWPPFILDRKGTSNFHFLAITTFLRVTLGRCGSRGPCLCHLCQRVQHRWSHILRALRANILDWLKVTRTLFFKGLPCLQESLMKHGNTPTRHCKYSAGICQRLSNSSEHLKNCQRFSNSLKHSSMLVKFHTQTLNLNFWTVHCSEPSVIGLQ